MRPWGARPEEAPPKKVVMKPKQHRLHHNRKRLARTDPRRICHAFIKEGGYHSETGVLNATELEDGTVYLKATCANCDKTIEGTIIPEDGRIGWEQLRAVEWRTWRFLIEEEPF